jgi:RNA polymerase sigma-70 factor (ECF subfamily)
MAPETRASVLQDFDRFHHLYRPTIVHWGRACGLQDADAEEVAQTVLLKLWEALRRFDYDPEKGKFRSWLRRVVTNAARDHYRGKERHPEPEGAGGTTVPELIHRLEGSANEEHLTSLIEALGEAPEREAVARAKAHTDPATWDVYYLRVVEERTAREVARATGKSEGAVHQAVYRVGKAIAQEYRQARRERGLPEDQP